MREESVKSPEAVLLFILPFDRLRAGFLPFMVSPSNHERLAATGAIYGAFVYFSFRDLLQRY